VVHDRRSLLFGSPGAPLLRGETPVVKCFRDDLGDRRIHPSLFGQGGGDRTVGGIGESPPLVVVNHRPERLKQPQGQARRLAQRVGLAADLIELIELAVAKERSDHLLGDSQRSINQTVVAQDLHEPIGLERRQLVVIADQEASARQHERADQLRPDRLGSLLDHDPVKLLARLD
jgi:hypothetical protein